MYSDIELHNIGSLPIFDGKELHYEKNTSIQVKDGIITNIGSPATAKSIDCKGKLVTPGFVDSHTHPIFHNTRNSEHLQRLSGISYEEIAKNGGGIVSSINGVRMSSAEELYLKALKRMDRFISLGTTSIEAKSGYGLDTESELKSLEVIEKTNSNHCIDLAPTFMGAHAFPPEYKNDHEGYVRLIIKDMIPRVAHQGIAKYIDVFCEEGYFSIAQTRSILECGLEHGLTPRIHADEFNNFGASQLASDVGAVSADHLMAIDDNSIQSLIDNNVVATLLPGTTFFLNKKTYAPARKLIDNGATVALATDYNPGSCHIQSMPFIMTLAVMNMSMTIEEAFIAATYHGAAALGFENEIGSVEINKKADLVVWDIDNLTDIAYYVTDHPIRYVIKNGQIVFGA